MYKIHFKRLVLTALIFIIVSPSWAKGLITPEGLAVLSIEFITSNGTIKHRPCPKKFQSNCPAGVPSSCLLVLSSDAPSGTVTITNNSNITATNITANQAFLNSVNLSQSPTGGITSLASRASAVLTFTSNVSVIDPPVTIEIKGDNTISTCFSIQVLP